MKQYPQLGPVIIRRVSEGENYGLTLECWPGKITVLPGAIDGEAEGLVDSLLSKGERLFRLSAGPEQLHCSEIHIVGISGYRWHEPTVEGVLRNLGIDEQHIRGLLGQVGLGDSLLISPSQLTKCESRRLMILSSFFMKARILLYDRPFFGMDAEWVESIAHFMLESAESSGRPSLVSGLECVPEIWWENPLVNVLDSKLKRRGAFLPIPVKRSMPPEVSVKAYVLSASDEHGHFIITKPQMIHRPTTRASSPTKVKSEVIPNPNIIDLFAEEGSLSDRGPSAKTMVLKTDYLLPPQSRKQKKGALTRTTSLMRIFRSFGVDAVFRSLKQLVSSLSQAGRLSSWIPPSARIAA